MSLTFTPAKLAGGKLKKYDPAADPLADVQYTGDAEHDNQAEFSAIGAAFKARADEEAARFKDVTDSEYWFCVCFRNREQVEEFLRKTGWGPEDAKYVDGENVARVLKVAIPEARKVTTKTRKANDRLMRLVR